jgi:hypothetical protein
MYPKSGIFYATSRLPRNYYPITVTHMHTPTTATPYIHALAMAVCTLFLLPAAAHASYTASSPSLYSQYVPSAYTQYASAGAATTGASASQPYVTLSQVPYTGLDLGPFGLVAYWTFLTLWCLFMAYLVAIKQVHYVLANRLKGFLFGADDEDEEEETIEIIPAHASKAAPVRPHMVIPTYAAAVAQGEDPVDEFILSQIHRVA